MSFSAVISFQDNSLTNFTDLARKFGPFFFSVLFLTYIMFWAQRKYAKLMSRPAPPPTSQEKIVHLVVFLGSFVFGIVLVCISVYWWIHFGQSNYVYRGVFKGLHGYEQLSSDDRDAIFFRDETLKPNGPLGPTTDLLHNSHFLVVRGSSFVDCQTFQVGFSKGEGGDNQSIDVEYRTGDESGPEPVFTIAFDRTQKKNVLTRTGPPKKPCQTASSRLSLPNLVPTVYASAPQTAGKKKAQSKDAFAMAQVSPVIDSPASSDIRTLQDIRSSVGTKLHAIVEFSALPQEVRDAALSSATDTEPVLVTFLDLTRHSDTELAYRVIGALEQFDSDRYVAGLARSNDTNLRRMALTEITHMESAQVDRLLEKLKSERSPEYGTIYATTRNENNFVRLRPTGSPQGDRYYVRARWDAGSQPTTDCLTRLFKSELISNRSIQQEAMKMTGRNERLVYWYTKEWAVQIARQVRACGGSAAYVSPNAY